MMRFVTKLTYRKTPEPERSKPGADNPGVCDA